MRLASAAALSVSLHGAVAAAVWLAIGGSHPPATPPIAPIPVELVVASPPAAREGAAPPATAQAPPDVAPSPSPEAAEAPLPAPPIAAADEPPPASPPPEPAALLSPPLPPAEAVPRAEALPPRPAARRPDRPAPAPALAPAPSATSMPAAAPPSEPAAAAAVTEGAQPAADARGPQTAALPATPVRAGVAGSAGNPAPIYPEEESRARGEEGRVVLHVVVGADGRPTAVTVKSSSRYRRLDDAARAAVRRWRFAPATVGGVAVDGSLDVPIVFRLE